MLNELLPGDVAVLCFTVSGAPARAVWYTGFDRWPTVEGCMPNDATIGLLVAIPKPDCCLILWNSQLMRLPLSQMNISLGARYQVELRLWIRRREFNVPKEP